MIRVIIISGHPASGKTTVSKAIAEKLGNRWKHLSIDDFLRPYFSRMEPGVKPLAYDNIRSVACNFIKYGYNLIVEGRLFFQEKYLSQFMRYLGRKGIGFAVFELNVPEKEALRRNRLRDVSERKPDEKIVHFHRNFEPCCSKRLIRIQNDDLEETCRIMLEAAR